MSLFASDTMRTVQVCNLPNLEITELITCKKDHGMLVHAVSSVSTKHISLVLKAILGYVTLHCLIFFVSE